MSLISSTHSVFLITTALVILSLIHTSYCVPDHCHTSVVWPLSVACTNPGQFIDHISACCLDWSFAFLLTMSLPVACTLLSAYSADYIHHITILGWSSRMCFGVLISSIPMMCVWNILLIDCVKKYIFFPAFFKKLMAKSDFFKRLVMPFSKTFTCLLSKMELVSTVLVLQDLQKCDRQSGN